MRDRFLLTHLLSVVILGFLVMGGILPAAPVQSGPPSAPYISAGNRTTSSIAWSWSSVSGATGYELHDDHHNVIQALGASATSATETGLGENAYVSRHLHAFNSYGPSPASNLVSTYTAVHNPGTADFSLTAVSPYEVDITVTPPPNGNAGQTKVLLTRSTDGQTFIAVQNNTYGYTFIDTGLNPDTMYYYEVQFMNGDDSALTTISPFLPVETQEGTPLNVNLSLGVTVLSSTSLQYTWVDQPGETGFVIHDEKHTQIGVVEQGVLTFTETGLTENTLYHRHIHCLDVSGLGPASPPVNTCTKVHDPTAAEIGAVSITSFEIDATAATPFNGLVGSTQAVFYRSTDGVNYSGLGGSHYAYTYKDTGVHPLTTYWYKFYYVNILGTSQSAYSPPIQITTGSGSPNQAPTSFTGSVQSTSSIRWSWNDINWEQGFVLHDDNHNVIATVGTGVTSYTETGLAENAYASRHVHGVSSGGTSVFQSPTAAVATWVHSPGTGDFTLTALSGPQIEVAVTVPPSGFGRYAQVSIDRSPDNSSWTNVKSYSTNTYTFDDSVPAANTTYYYRVTFRNQDAITTSVSASKSIVSGSALSIPIPTGLTGTAQTYGTMKWTWNDVTGETGFILHDELHHVIQTLAQGVLTYTETGLPENSRTCRHIHAITSSGTGAASLPAAVYTQVHTPTVSDFLVQLASSYENDITVTPPANSAMGFTGVTILNSQYNNNFTVIKSASTMGWSYKNTGLWPHQSYYYEIQFVNGDGLQTTPASPSELAPTSQPAPPPTQWMTSLAITNQTISSLTWQGGGQLDSHLTGVSVKDVRSGWTGSYALPSQTDTVVQGGMTENQRSEGYGAYIDDGGTGLYSGPYVHYTKVHDPGPQDITLTAPSPNEVDVTITPLPNGWDAGTGVQLYRSTDQSTWTNLQNGSNYTYTDLGVGGSTTYYYKIIFSNADGSYITTQNPYIASITTPAGAPSQPPAGLTASAQTTSSVQWTWSDVPGETGFYLHNDQHQVMATLAAGIHSFTETGLPENSLVSRHVHAKNAAGTGPASTRTETFTLIHTPTTSDFSLAVISGNEIDLTVNPPPNSTLGNTGVWMRRSTDNASWTYLGSTSQRYYYADTSLSGQTTYYYQIQFQNGNYVTTSWSPSLSATTPLLVNPPAITTASKRVKSPNPTLQGTGATGQTISIFFNGVLDGTTTVSNGTWNYSTVTAKAEGSYTVTAQATQSGVVSSKSFPIQVTVVLTPPQPPANIRTTTYSTVIDVEWDPSPSSHVAGYNVWRKTGTGGTFSQLNTPGVVLGGKYRDTTPTNGQLYVYGVEAVDDALPN